MKIGLVQFDSCSNKIENSHKAILKIKELAQSGAEVICTQELFKTDYFCHEENKEYFDLADSIVESELSEYVTLACEYKVVLILSLFEKRAKGLFHNTAVVIDADGTILGKYRKMHIPDDPGYYEKYYFAPGDLGYRVFATAYGRIGVLICWDQWYPEAARLTALNGADVLIYPTAIGWDADASEVIRKEELDAWLIIQKSHAIANGVFVVSVNRTGVEHGLQFWGNSFVCNPLGVVIKQLGTEEEQSLVTIDLGAIEKYRRVWPFLRDRRVDSFSDLTKRYIDEI